MMDLKNFSLLHESVRPLWNSDNEYCGLVQGNIGLLLCYAQEYICSHQEKYKNKMYALVEELLNNTIRFFSLGYGLAGVGWVFNLIRQFELFDNLDDWLDDFELELEGYYYMKLQNGDLDYFRGASGILFYFLEKGNITKKMINAYINCLLERDRSICPSYYIEGDRTNINLGIPHGITGVILVLLLLKENGEKAVDSLINDLLNELLSYKRIDKSYHFPAIVSQKKELPSGLAWCYGDLMISYALLKAGILLNNNKYSQIVEPVLQSLIIREDCPKKLTLCHGYVSTALVFERMYKMTNISSLRRAGKKWQDKAVFEFTQRYKLYVLHKKYADYFENASLFYGFSGFLLSQNFVFKKECERAMLL